jgi:hypothetical protein
VVRYWKTVAVERAYFLALAYANLHEAMHPTHQVTTDAPYRCLDCKWAEQWTERANKEGEEDEIIRILSN